MTQAATFAFLDPGPRPFAAGGAPAPSSAFVDDSNYGPLFGSVKPAAAHAAAATADDRGIHAMGFDPYLVQRALGMHDYNEEHSIDALVSGLVTDDRKHGVQGQQQHDDANLILGGSKKAAAPAKASPGASAAAKPAASSSKVHASARSRAIQF